jgi:hypothetical protein
MPSDAMQSMLEGASLFRSSSSRVVPAHLTISAGSAVLSAIFISISRSQGLGPVLAQKTQKMDQDLGHGTLQRQRAAAALVHEVGAHARRAFCVVSRG